MIDIAEVIKNAEHIELGGTVEAGSSIESDFYCCNGFNVVAFGLNTDDEPVNIDVVWLHDQNGENGKDTDILESGAGLTEVKADSFKLVLKNNDTVVHEISLHAYLKA
ncbi:hypothetical protein U0355_13050 [Salimicrobium sp. PL1-032A]|uniref:hypothetical protein n=1 Tax=Salimicrobium sp. PL1-032A TaxID=3095364 RepID=UPI0032610F81